MQDPIDPGGCALYGCGVGKIGGDESLFRAQIGWRLQIRQHQIVDRWKQAPEPRSNATCRSSQENAHRVGLPLFARDYRQLMQEIPDIKLFYEHEEYDRHGRRDMRATEPKMKPMAAMPRIMTAGGM